MKSKKRLAILMLVSTMLIMTSLSGCGGKDIEENVTRSIVQQYR